MFEDSNGDLTQVLNFLDVNVILKNNNKTGTNVYSKHIKPAIIYPTTVRAQDHVKTIM